MEPERFDRLTRSMATGASRRALLRRLAGAVLGGAFARPAAAATATACQPDGRTCGAPAECCSGNCVFGTCERCEASGEYCDADVLCCGGLACRDGACCGAEQHVCASDVECCPGLECDPRLGRCVSPGGRGAPCSPSGRCQAGLTCCPSLNPRGSCVDPQRDQANCGGCGIVCRPGPRGQLSRCEAGTCHQLPCEPGALPCSNERGEGGVICCRTGCCGSPAGHEYCCFG